MEQNKLLTMEDVKKQEQEIAISKKIWETPTLIEINKNQILGVGVNPTESAKTFT